MHNSTVSSVTTSDHTCDVLPKPAKVKHHDVLPKPAKININRFFPRSSEYRASTILLFTSLNFVFRLLGVYYASRRNSFFFDFNQNSSNHKAEKLIFALLIYTLEKFRFSFSLVKTFVQKTTTTIYLKLREVAY